MNIFCVAWNYVEHAHELNQGISKNPIIFIKPDTALLRNNDAFYFPDFSSHIDYEVELIIKINRKGKNIQKKFAHKYYNEFGMGIDLTARDIQKQAIKDGQPWTIAKGFNSSAPVSKFIDIKSMENMKDVNFSLRLNGETKQEGNTSLMSYDFDDLVCYISQFFTFKKGDLIFTGTPKGVGAIKIGDRIEGYIEDEKMIDFEIK